MRAKLVNESFYDFEHEERMRKRREEFERESRELEQRAKNIVDKIPEPKEEIKLAGSYIPPEFRTESKIQQKRRRINLARARIEQLSLGKFPPTKDGIEQILNWRDEDGKPFGPYDYILRTNDGSGDLVVYDDSEKLGVEIATQLRNDYALVNDFPFTDVRPITFKNWKNRPFEEKISTYRDGKPRKDKSKDADDIIGRDD